VRWQWLWQCWAPLPPPPAPSPTSRLHTALSQLRSLSITACEHPDVPGLLGALATSCTQLTHLELSPTPWWSTTERDIPNLLSALDQLSSLQAFPNLQSLSIGRKLAFETSEEVSE
jgi:hypothetical protein